MSKDVGGNYRTVGSRKEGISNCVESDLDETGIVSEVLCIEEGHSSGFPPGICQVFIMEPSACTPGYCLLRLTKKINDNSEKNQVIMVLFHVTAILLAATTDSSRYLQSGIRCVTSWACTTPP